ncbi:hypothetical protein HOLDEFILI_03987 [Holdemania filiformis DSM 12042]|uniref:Uncharacterized protein n=1 Tax=Holdemania filiformis DSM 12042 TaxID=545696 RepID=B9YDR4_9FIRM|nr:hypothetical protein HOLDEFILI_03987 [Holdemania filiformis DSM 12042]
MISAVNGMEDHELLKNWRSEIFKMLFLMNILVIQYTYRLTDSRETG